MTYVSSYCLYSYILSIGYRITFEIHIGVLLFCSIISEEDVTTPKGMLPLPFLSNIVYFLCRLSS